MVGNKSLLGQIASFVGELSLSYHDVVEVIPYRNLVIMQRDKLHTAYGDVKKEITEADLMAAGKIQFSE